MKKNIIHSDLIRGLMLEVSEGNKNVLPIMHHLNTHYPRCEQILQWLKRNKITGEKLLVWIKGEFNSSPLKAYSYILGKIHKEKNYLVLLERDFKDEVFH